jgi:hypothetical protein
MLRQCSAQVTLMIMICADIIRDYQHNPRYQRSIINIPIVDAHQ